MVHGGSDLDSNARRVFPHISASVPDDGLSRYIRYRTIENFTIVRFRIPSVAAYASARRASEFGLANRIKLVWQLRGSTVYKNSVGRFDLHPGDATVLKIGNAYELRTGHDHHALALMFDADENGSWADLAENNEARTISANGAIAAAGAGIASLMRHASDGPPDRLAVDALLDLTARAFGGKQISWTNPDSRTYRATILVRANLAKPDYGPEDLAADLALSRRSLYNEFSRLGVTPALFIRQQRLKRAREEISRGDHDHLSLAQIAHRNGFSDSASFSHAFKKAFGVAPSVLRRAAIRQEDPRR